MSYLAQARAQKRESEFKNEVKKVKDMRMLELDAARGKGCEKEKGSVCMKMNIYLGEEVPCRRRYLLDTTQAKVASVH